MNTISRTIGAGSRAALLAWLCATVTTGRPVIAGPAPGPGNRLTHLDSNSPFYAGFETPRLTTPQWIGEPGVEAVVILSIDDLRQTDKHEAFLRPILERLKRIDGRAPVSVMCLDVAVTNAQLQAWLKEGLSLEVHTLTHRHPILSGGDFEAGAQDFHGSVDRLHRVPGNRPVAARLPYCDSMNVASPRFYSEIFNGISPEGRFLSIDSSVMNIFTPADPALPRALVRDAQGKPRFGKYLPAETNAVTRVNLGRFATAIENYPYPYVIQRRCWEFPIMHPSDWEASNAHGSNNPQTLADWKAALDATVIKQGVMTLCFHPHGWIQNTQLIELIDYAVARYGRRIKFLTFREALERLNENLLAGQPLRNAHGGDNGARLLDVNNDGYMDVVIGNWQVRQTRIWQPDLRRWRVSGFPTEVAGVQFGILGKSGQAMFISSVTTHVEPSPDSLAQTAARFDGEKWIEDPTLLKGLTLDGQPIVTRVAGRDRGVRLRDFNRDGVCELVVANDSQNAIFEWQADDRRWKRLDYALPKDARIVDNLGRDEGLRFVDFNGDGYTDVYFSNPRSYLLRLFVSQAVPNLGWKIGWNDEIVSGSREGAAADAPAAKALPLIVRNEPHRDNGAWFHHGFLVVQNEDTDRLPGQVERRSFDELLRADQPPPMTPEQTLATIRVPPGFKVELVAQEPLTMDPVSFDWGPDGKLWVAEMGDYPLGLDGHGKPGGVIRFLEDTNADGVYDQSTVFLEGVNFPNGVMPWRRGVLVSAAPEIFYAEDTDGDGKADVRKPLFVGFTEGNQQHRINGFDYGLDNWIHAANGDSGGNVLSVLTGKRTNIRGRDVRFRPDDGAFEATAGQTQYGRHRDDWGNWFGNNNANWLWHYYLPAHYLVRNPHLPVKSLKHLLAQYPDSALLFPTSPFLQRPNFPDAVNLVTAASAAMPYRDDLFGPEYAASVFICDPVYNLVHREVLDPDGVTFKSHRAASEPNREFFTSSDNWCRPVFTRVGPDGALYIADMYRFVIEHPEWIPERMQARLDLRAGDDKGRIYRVYPAKAKLRPHPRLDQLDTAGLVAALDHPNGWQRDTAQRLLVHRQDKTAVPLLARLVRSSPRPKARLQALCTLDGLDGLRVELLAEALRDAHAEVRRHAVRLCEGLFEQTNEVMAEHVVAQGDTLLSIAKRFGLNRVRAIEEANPGLNATALRVGQHIQVPIWPERLLALTRDPEIRVRYQLAFTLGEWTDPRASRALARLARRDWNNDAMQLAILSSAVPHVGVMLDTVLTEANGSPPASLLEKLFGLAVVLDRADALAQPLARLARPVNGQYQPWQFAAVAGLLDALDRRRLTWEGLAAKSNLKATLQQLTPLFTAARDQIDHASRITHHVSRFTLPAIRLLGRGPDQRAEDLARLSALLKPQVPPDLQRAALEALRRVGGGQVGELLLAGWRSYSPDLRVEVLNVLCSRQSWLQALLGAIESETIPPTQIDPGHQQTLLTHAQKDIRDRAAKLFTTAAPDREAIVRAYRQVAELKGDAGKGAELFQKNCATCHLLQGKGTSIGADLGTVADRPLDYLLEAIFHPNKAVEARYISYTVVTRDESEFSGIITAETPNSITMRNATGEKTFLRADIAELTSSSLSLMPEGFEAAFKPQDLADLLEFVKTNAGKSGGKK